MRLDVTRSGGFANLQVTGSVETSELPEAERAELERLVGELDLDDLARRSPIRGRGADRFQYELSIRRGEGECQVVIAEDAAPPPLRRLVEKILELSRQR